MSDDWISYCNGFFGGFCTTVFLLMLFKMPLAVRHFLKCLFSGPRESADPFEKYR